MLHINEAPLIDVHLVKSTEAPGGVSGENFGNVELVTIERLLGIALIGCELTFRSRRTRPAHGRSSGSETLWRIRSLAGYTVDTEATAKSCRRQPHSARRRGALFDPVRPPISI